jgi:hypothetical protein
VVVGLGCSSASEHESGKDAREAPLNPVEGHHVPAALRSEIGQIGAVVGDNAQAIGVPLFTAVILLEPNSAGTKYTATAIHGDEDGAQKHGKMGFHDGWGKALYQLVALAKTM